MFTSLATRSVLGLSALFALLVTLSVQQSPAQTTSRTLEPSGAPGQTNVVIGQATTVVSSVHYQAYLQLTCATLSCSGSFPPPGDKHRLNVTRLNCGFGGTAGAKPAIGQLILHNSANTPLLAEYLAADYSVSDGTHMVDQPIDIQVSAKQHVAVSLSLLSGTASTGYCTATGTLDTLQ